MRGHDPAMSRKRRADRRLAARQRAARRFWRLWAFAGVAAVVVAAAGFLLWPVLKPDDELPPGSVPIQVSMGGFSPSRIQATAGQPVKIRFINNDDKYHTDGGGWHQWAIDELGVDVRIPPSSTKDFTFVPPSSGSFLVYCDVCCGGKENPYMRGTLAVA